MTTQFDSRLHRIRQRIHTLLWIHGVSWLLSVVVGGLLGACLVDWLVHIDDPVIRVLWSVTTLVTACWIAWIKLIRPLWTPLSDLDIAHKIEGRFPQFRDSLTSSVQFAADPGNTRVGSPQLQRHVVDATQQQVRQSHLNDVLTTAPLRRVTAGACALLITAFLLAGLNRANAAIAIQRMLFPFTAGNWPRICELRFVDSELSPLSERGPLRVARGETVNLYVQNVNGAVPDDAQLQLRYPDGRVVSEDLSRANLVDNSGATRPVAASRIRAVTRGLHFRAVGGDHRNMRWRQLEVLSLPQAQRLSVRLVPPPYTRQPAQQLASGVGHVTGLVGTQVHISGRANMNLETASLKIRDHVVGRLQLESNRRNFKAEFTIPEPGVYSYVLSLKDWRGFENRDFQRYEIRGIADRVPELTVARPSSDIQVTPTADLELQLQITDDIGLRELVLVYGEADSTPDEPRREVLQTFDHETEATTHHTWQLSTLQLTAGQRLKYHFEASDHCDLVEDHVGRTPPLTLRVVTPPEKRSELGERLNQIVEDLQRLVATQSTARDLVQEFRIQLTTVGVLQQRDVDLLKRVEFDQRQISNRLLNTHTGIRDRSQSVADDLAINHLVDPELNQQLQRIVEDITLLETDFLPPIEQQLTRVRKMAVSRGGDLGNDTAQRPVTDASARLDGSSNINTRSGQTEALADAIENQNSVIDVLQSLLSAVSDAQRERNMAQALEALIQQQTQLNQQSAAMGERTLTRDFESLSTQDQSDLARLAARQDRQTAALQTFHDALSKIASEGREEQSASNPVVQEMLDQIHDQALIPRSRELIPLLETNRIGEATRRQQELLQELLSLDDLLRQRDSTDTDTRIQQLTEAEQHVTKLKQRAEEIRRQTQAATETGHDDPVLAERQGSLRDDTRRLARRLRRLRVEGAQQAARRAAQQMKQAGAQLQNGSPRQALDPQQEAIDDLEQTRSETALERRRAQEQLAREAMKRLGSALLVLQERQRDLVSNSVDMQQQYLETGRWTRRHLKALLKLASDQDALQADASGLLHALRPVEVISLALRGAVQNMQTATKRIRLRQVDKTTIAWQARAERRLGDLLKALEPADSDPDTNQQGTASEQQSSATDSQQPDLIQLRLLVVLQQDLNTRVTELDTLRQRQGQLNADQQAELREVGQRQAEIATLARGLLKPPEQDSALNDN